MTRFGDTGPSDPDKIDSYSGGTPPQAFSVPRLVRSRLVAVGWGPGRDSRETEEMQLPPCSGTLTGHFRITGVFSSESFGGYTRVSYWWATMGVFLG